jgi:actin-related protein
MPTGGLTAVRGFDDRLLSEIRLHTSPAFKARLETPTPLLQGRYMSRAACPWIGGSILASLDSLGPFWVSAAEYEEHGASIFARKF